jgi:hypothetical protein
MTANMKRRFPGPFAAREVANGTWLLSRGTPELIEVLVRGADATARDALRSPTLSDLDIEWRDAGALLIVTSAGEPKSIQASSVIVHQPLTRLYENLPLASLDGRARRFWRSVFLLARIPGGRSLLGRLAQRRRGPR